MNRSCLNLIVRREKSINRYQREEEYQYDESTLGLGKLGKAMQLEGAPELVEEFLHTFGVRVGSPE
jgi:hypothetical protein